MSAPLIILARGQSSNRLEQLLAAHPRARIWSLNGAHGELDRLKIKPELQFEIHPPRPRSNLIPDVPAILSPFASTILASNLEARFPFAAACELGACFFEITPDFLLAYAALLISGRLPLDAVPLPYRCAVSEVLDRPASRDFFIRPSAIHLCGVDCADDNLRAQPRRQFLDRRAAWPRRRRDRAARECLHPWHAPHQPWPRRSPRPLRLRATPRTRRGVLCRFSREVYEGGEGMSSDPRDYIDHSFSSDCCGASALGEVDDEGFGLCAECHDHAHFSAAESASEPSPPSPTSRETL